MQLPDYDRDVKSVQETSLSFVDITSQMLQRIKDTASLNAYLTVNPHALEEATQMDRTSGTDLILRGMSIAIKDNISVVGMPMTCGSKMLENFQPMFDATVIKNIKKQGGVILGKVNMDEFAMGSSGETSYFGPTDHPHFTGYVPGGSSSGSAVAVAAGLCHASLGSDTGGSVRQPAAFCGIFGFKPSYGRISRYGLTAFASSLDQIGIFSSNIPTMARVFDVVSGHDIHDSTTADVASTKSFEKISSHAPRLDTLTLAILHDSELDGVDREIRHAYDSVVAALRAQGVSFVHATIPGSKAWIPTYYILATAEASSNLARYDGVRYGWRDTSNPDITTASRTSGFGMEVKRRIMLGTYVLSSGYYEAYYIKAQKARRAIANGYHSIFQNADALLLPTTAGLPFKRGEKKDPIEMYLSDYFTVSANIAGIPAISFPAGHSESGLPIGLQLQSALMKDEELLAITSSIVQGLS